VQAHVLQTGHTLNYKLYKYVECCATAGALQQSGLPKFVKSAALLAARLLVATFVLWSGAAQAHLLRLQHSYLVIDQCTDAFGSD